MSNILELYLFDKPRLIKCRDNLFELLKDNGEIICSCVCDCKPSERELNIFSEKFNFEGFGYRMIDDEYLIGY